MIVCWLPSALFLLASAWIRDYEVWDAWAAAPLLLSLVLGMLGLALFVQAGRDDARRAVLVWATLLAGAPVLWLQPGRVLEEMRRSFF